MLQLKENDKNNSSGWIYSIWKTFTYGIHEYPKSARLGQDKQDSPLHGARVRHQLVMKQHKGWNIVLSAESDSWQQRTAWPVMLSEREILWDWHLIKGSFQSIFWSAVWNWRSLICVCEKCRSGELLQGCWQSWSAVSHSQQKQIYSIMQSEDGNGAAVLPQATFSPSPSLALLIFTLCPQGSDYWIYSWLVGAWTFPHVKGKPISWSNFKSMYRMRLQNLFVRANCCSLTRCASLQIVLQLWLLLLNQSLLILSKLNCHYVQSQWNWKIETKLM